MAKYIILDFTEKVVGVNTVAAYEPRIEEYTVQPIELGHLDEATVVEVLNYIRSISNLEEDRFAITAELHSPYEDSINTIEKALANSLEVNFNKYLNIK